MSVVHITEENFEELVLKNEKKVLLDFWATWCGPCRMIAPIVEQIASEREDILVGKIDVDQEMALAVRFGIVSIRTAVSHRKHAVSGKAVAAHFIGFALALDFAVQQTAHHGEQHGIAAAPVSGVTAPNIFHAAAVGEADELRTRIGDNRVHVSFVQFQFHQLNLPYII